MIFDFEDGEFINKISDDIGIDFDGHTHLKIGNNMSMDLEDGNIHLTSNWNAEEDN